MQAGDYPVTSFGRARRVGGRHGHVAYFPAPIPRQIDLTGSTARLLGEAEAALGRLAGISGLLPSPSLLTRPYVLREALSSTRIEGTRATMAEVLESDASDERPNADVEEVLGYIDALTWGLAQLDKLPLSSRLLREMHRRLLAGTRGRSRAPGELRTTQNWIGAPGSTIETAEFVPPPAQELADLLTDWERFANEDTGLPVLVQNALLHAQFETIHPFLDGNGRLGRLVLVLFLIARGRIAEPLVYLSSYIEADRERYYESLRAVRQRGDATPWIDLLLEAIESQANDAVGRTRQVIEIRERYREEAARLSTANAFALVDVICESPVLTSRLVERRLDVSRPTALRLLSRLEERGVLREGAPGTRGKRQYVAEEMMAAVSGDGDGDVSGGQAAKLKEKTVHRSGDML